MNACEAEPLFAAVHLRLRAELAGALATLCAAEAESAAVAPPVLQRLAWVLQCYSDLHGVEAELCGRGAHTAIGNPDLLHGLGELQARVSAALAPGGRSPDRLGAVRQYLGLFLAEALVQMHVKETEDEPALSCRLGRHGMRRMHEGLGAVLAALQARGPATPTPQRPWLPPPSEVRSAAAGAAPRGMLA